MNLDKLLLQIKPLAELSTEMRKEIIAQCRALELKRNDFLFQAGNLAENAFLILMGSVKLFRSNPDGRHRIVHILLPGDVAAAPVVLNHAPYPVSAQTLEQSVALIIPSTYLSQLLQKPIVGETILNQMTERMLQAHQDQIAIYDSTEKRIAYFLMELFERAQIHWGQTSRIPIPLTRQDIADRIGASVETVIRIISQWQKQNLLATHDKYFEIPDLALLKKVAGL